MKISLTKKPGALFLPKLISIAKSLCSEQNLEGPGLLAYSTVAVGPPQMALTHLFFSVRSFSQLRLVNGVFFSVNVFFFFSKEKNK